MDLLHLLQNTFIFFPSQSSHNPQTLQCPWGARKVPQHLKVIGDCVRRRDTRDPPAVGPVSLWLQPCCCFELWVNCIAEQPGSEQ